MKTLRVKVAKPGLLFPLEGKRMYPDENGVMQNVIGEEPVVVESTSYYRKGVRKGDLVEVPAEIPTKAPPAKASRKGE